MGGAEGEERMRGVSKINSIIGRGKRVIFVTNNSNVSRKVLLRDIENEQVRVSDTDLSRLISKSGGSRDSVMEKVAHQHVVTAGNTCAWFLKKKGITKPF